MTRVTHIFRRTSAALLIAGMATLCRALQPALAADVSMGIYRQAAPSAALYRWARAEARLCFRYQTGDGVPKSFTVAAAYCRVAAERGDPVAQYLLGLMYDKGQGVPQDTVLAYVWLDLAAANAPPHTRDAFARMRDALASKMTNGQIVQAQAMAIAWANR
jgi:TPR repeat protein